MLTVLSLIDDNSSINVTKTQKESKFIIISNIFLLKITASCKVVDANISLMMMMLLGEAVLRMSWIRINPDYA